MVSSELETALGLGDRQRTPDHLWEGGDDWCGWSGHPGERIEFGDWEIDSFGALSGFVTGTEKGCAMCLGGVASAGPHVKSHLAHEDWRVHVHRQVVK